MSNKGHDIDDDEIRIISSRPQPLKPGQQRPRRGRKWLLLAFVVGFLTAALFVALKGCGSEAAEDDGEYPVLKQPGTIESEGNLPVDSVPADNDAAADTRTELPGQTVTQVEPVKAHIAMRDTTVSGARLTVYTPVDAVAELAIGVEALADSTVLMAFQAADIRADNGQIVSAFVERGQLISTGQSKAGFCAIIDGKITLGVADVTQYFEQALTSGGYFFRQYPLVVGNQVIENKPRGKSLRKALAELNGRVVVVVSHNELTFGEFSRALVDMGVSTAIYLVGSKSYGIVRLPDGDVLEYNIQSDRKYPEYTNFIVWK